MSIISAVTSALSLTASIPQYTPSCTYSSGEHVTTTQIRIQPVYYSESFNLPYPTVIDPFRNNASVTIQPGPTTVITSGQTTATASFVVDPLEFFTIIIGESFPPSPATSSLTTTAAVTTTTPSMIIPPSTVPITSTTTCTLNTVPTPAQADIAAAINQWQTDIQTVNAFLEAALDDFAYTTFNAIRLASEHAYAVAVDEPCQFQTLQNALDVWTIPPNVNSSIYTTYQCAKNDLAGVFGPEVLGNLNNAINDPPGFDPYATRINVNRCCRVLPDVQILFQLASSINPGVPPVANNLVVPIPDTCSLVDCSQFPSRTPCSL